MSIESAIREVMADEITSGFEAFKRDVLPESVKAIVNNLMTASSFAEAFEELFQDQLNGRVFTSNVESIIDNFDLSEKIEEVVDNMDLDDKVEDAVDRIDFEEKIEDHISNMDLEQTVKSVIENNELIDDAIRATLSSERIRRLISKELESMVDEAVDNVLDAKVARILDARGISRSKNLELVEKFFAHIASFFKREEPSC